MALQDRWRWDLKYRGGLAPQQPDPDVVNALNVIMAMGGGEPPIALDFACGAGRHLGVLAAAGFDCEGFDISPEGLAVARAHGRGVARRISLVAADLEEFTIPPERYGLVLVCDYLARGRYDAIARAVAPGGWLLIVGFLAGHPTQKPHWTHQPGEIPAAFAGFQPAISREEQGRIVFAARRIS
jgi:SAM-dependent methyltransferase